MRLERVSALVVGLGVLAGLGALYVYGARRRAARGDEEASDVSPLLDSVLEAAGTKVLDRERADGVDGRLQWLLDEWERSGTHVVRVAGGTFGGHRYCGGVRDLQQQLDDFNAGLSKANGPDTAPHMHGGALDVWPKDFVPNRSFEEQPVPADYRALFATFSDFARERGFTVGADWSNPDLPHVEVRDWRSLPLPLSTQAAKGS